MCVVHFVIVAYDLQRNLIEKVSILQIYDMSFLS